ncbi:MAG: decarboxylating NADP(+)-dependent phosphogluconate dehydrogenase [Candidatus Kariarchaeaceae archaeon]|jgi:6-phosphogluconate dehydrogenase
MSADIGLIGLAVMGQNLVLNMIEKNYTVAVYNRTISKVEKFVDIAKKGSSLIGTSSIQEFIKILKNPRKILLMVKSGKPVDDLIEEIIPLLEEGDILIDGGNSNFKDTIRREGYLKQKKIRFVGVGISGGEEGARNGPSIMPGGSISAWTDIREILEKISAKVDNTPCCAWLGENGAGHFVKMVHNGIEYGDMQLISEAYQLMKDGLQLNHEKMSLIFNKWNENQLDSYLIEITGEILSHKDNITNKPLVSVILDKAGQKGTGMWTVMNALELGIPTTLIGESVFQRSLSSLKGERKIASELFDKRSPPDLNEEEKAHMVDKLEQALYASKLVSYSQGFDLLRAGSKHYKWNLDLGNISLIWRNGCIIRSSFLTNIQDAYSQNPDLANLLFDPHFKEIITDCVDAWREIVVLGTRLGIPIPGLASALSYFDSLRSEFLPTNLIQAQRDYFGAHGYERVDQMEGQFYHSDWHQN